MKKTRFGKPAFSVAMSTETGCVVMTRTVGDQVEIMGSLTREQSVAFCLSIVNWAPEAIAKEERPTLSLVN